MKKQSFKDIFSQITKVPEKLTVTKWAEKNVYLNSGVSAISGRFKAFAYQKEIMNIATDEKIKKITLMWGAQLGKTLLVNNIIGYHIAQEPESQIMMQPSESDVKTWLETKFNPLCDNSTSVKNSLSKPRGRDGVNNQKMKSYRGCFLMLSYSGSPNTMRGRSAPKIYCDEVDGYERTGEGHPVNLLWQRSATFGSKRKMLITSTPTIKNESFVEASYLDGDQRQFYIPCIHCNFYQVLKWSNVSWEKENKKNKPETAVYICEKCKKEINDHKKIKMLKKGKWISKTKCDGHASYHLNELYSPFRKFEDIVRSFLEKKATSDLQSFVNVSLAETWEIQGDKIESHFLKQKLEKFSEEVPFNVAILTAGIDMQNDRFEIQVVGWGVGEEAYIIDYVVIYGDMTTDNIWNELKNFLNAKTYMHESTKKIKISRAALDTGGTFTSLAYDFIATCILGKPYAIKGVGGKIATAFVSSHSTKKTSKNKKIKLFALGVDEAKNTIFSRLQINDFGSGYIHFNVKCCDNEYFEQFTAEKRITKYVRGFLKYEWINARHNKRNEAFDTFIYSLAALRIGFKDLNYLHKKLLNDENQSTKKRRKIKIIDNF